jgi:hypothetical protein
MYDVVPLIMGRLGNQLFMIANAYAYSLRYGYNFKLEDKKDCGNRGVYYDNILIELKKYINKDIKHSHTYSEPRFEFTAIPRIGNHLKLFGYFQSDKYFKDYHNEIKELFALPFYIKDSIDEYTTKDVVVAIHIRRTDYLNHPNYHPTQNKEYYEKGKKIIEDKLESRPTYYYFSDDKEWVKSTFELNDKDKIVDFKEDYMEFALMQQCNHFIIANSTFSWWAAWLSQIDKNKIVIAPSKWFGPEANKNWQDIYCENWIVI